MDLFFSYSPDGGFEFHGTKEAAVKAAQECLDIESDNAGDGWSEEVDQICWGVVCQNAEKTNERPAEPGSDFDYICEYELGDVTDLRKTLLECLPSNPKADVAPASGAHVQRVVGQTGPQEAK